MDEPLPPTDPLLSPRAAALYARLRELDHASDTTELRLAGVLKQLKTAEARAETDPIDALDQIERAQAQLRRRAA